MAKNRTAKGEGSHLARQLSAPEKCKLAVWVFQNKEAAENSTVDELTKLATDALGFEVSRSSVQTCKNATFPELIKIRRPRGLGRSRINREKMIHDLEERVSIIEKRLSMMRIEKQPNLPGV